MSGVEKGRYFNLYQSLLTRMSIKASLKFLAAAGGGCRGGLGSSTSQALTG